MKFGIIALAMGLALSVTGCTAGTAPVPQVCLDALDAADTAITDASGVGGVTAELIVDISNSDLSALDQHVTEIQSQTAVSQRSAEAYVALRNQCREEGS